MAKTVKSDAKKAAKKAAAEHQKKLEATVKAAYDVDPATALAPFLARPFSKNGIDAVAAPSTVKQLSADDKKWIWKLLEGNMRPVFGEEVWKAREGKDKKNEMVDGDARPSSFEAHRPLPGERIPTDWHPVTLGFVHYLRHRGGRRGDVRVRAAAEWRPGAGAVHMLCEALAKRRACPA